MPNWCNNNVEISGPKKVIDQIEKIVDEKKNKKGQGLLDWMVPMPKELRETQADGTERKDLIKKYGHSDWYSWANSEWGTKWDCANDFYGFDRKDESTITFGFDTAWAPALTAFETWLANNEDCSLKCMYYEPGCDFAGVWDNGHDQCEPAGQAVGEFDEGGSTFGSGDDFTVARRPVFSASGTASGCPDECPPEYDEEIPGQRDPGIAPEPTHDALDSA